MANCSGCGRRVVRSFRFCPWCATPLRRKLVEFFPAHPHIDSDRGKALRASAYLDPEDERRHVRLSVWTEDGVAEAAISLSPAEADRLSNFLDWIKPSRVAPDPDPDATRTVTHL